MRKCRVCKVPYEPRNSLQKACSILCAMALAKIDRERAESREAKQRRREQREARERIKPRSQWMREAQAAFNQFIRERDHDLPCISCGTFTPMTRGGDYDCGHYRSVGANPELRFTELNSHKQCKRCNGHLSGNIVNYRIGLLARIGQEAIDWLEGPHEPKKYSIEELQEIKRDYSGRARELKKQRERRAA